MKKAIHGPLPTKLHPVVVTGCGRSGTLYITKFWKVLGLEIGHEVYRKDGIASWYLPVSNRLDQFKREIGLPNCIIFHQIRHPLKVISSMYKREWTEPTIPEMCHITEKDSRLVQKAKYWYYWNRHVEKLFPITLRYRIEDIQRRDLIERMAKISGVVSKGKISEIRKISTTTHSFYKRKKYKKGYVHIYTWEELEKESEKVYRQVLRLANKYGYY